MEYIRIVVIQIINRNLGDGVIADCTKYLCEKAFPYLKRDHYIIIPYNIYSEDYEMLKNADMIIFVGGGIIKYKYEMFYDYVAKILTYAEENSIPVFMNGVGVEGYDSSDERCCTLKNALNLNCVKEITVRDDLDTLQNKYMQNKSVILKSVYDPAVWVPQVYQKERLADSDIIGLGIIRHKIFYDNGIPAIDKSYLLEFWKGIIELLEQENFKWKIFTNGLKSDEDFADEVLEYAGFAENKDKYKIARMLEPNELVDTIAGFKAIIACRLHANIIAYALGVPSVALAWNDKLIFFGEKTGYPERYITSDKIDVKLVWNRLKQAMQEGTRKISRREKMKILRELRRFIRKYGVAKNREHTNINWENCLMATALGGKNFLYCNMNIPEMLADSYRLGFRWMEIDVRLSNDDKLVCVNGWNDAIYSKLGISGAPYGKKGMSEETFLKMKYYGKYSTVNFEQMIKAAEKCEDIKLVLDIGKPEKTRLRILLEQINQIIPEAMTENIYLRVQRDFDIVTMKELGMKFKIMYYIDKKQNLEAVIKTCKKYSVDWVSMKIDNYEEDMVVKLKDQNIHVCVFSVDTLTKAVELIKAGVSLVSSHYLKVNLLKRLKN